MRKRLGYATVLFVVATGSAGAQGVDENEPLPRFSGSGKLVCAEVDQRYALHGADMNARETNFLLFDAAARGCRDLVATLLDGGAALQARDRFGNTALLIAARMGRTEVVGLLLDRGAAVDHANLAGSTALLRAVTLDRRRAVEEMLTAGADPNLANRRGITPLAAAAFNGDDRLLGRLLEHGARPDPVDLTGKSPLVYAASKGYARTARAPTSPWAGPITSPWSTCRAGKCCSTSWSAAGPGASP